MELALEEAKDSRGNEIEGKRYLYGAKNRPTPYYPKIRTPLKLPSGNDLEDRRVWIRGRPLQTPPLVRIPVRLACSPAHDGFFRDGNG